MAAAYSFIYLVIPFLLKRKYALFIPLTAVHALLYGFSIWMLYYNVPFFGLKGEFPVFYWQKIILAAITNYEVPAFVATIKLFKAWYTDQQQKQELVSEKQQAELNFLKTQIHPHFLFNTLNNLYALTLKKSDAAPDVVIKLSDLLRYMLYECSEKFVPLTKEITFINNFIELQSIRHDRNIVKIEHQIKGEPNNKNIAPLLLLPIVENCFKHGITQDNKEVFIQIFLTIKSTSIELHVRNTLANNKHSFTEGLGINNIRRRLELIYPNHHQFDIDTSQGYFDVKLIITPV